MNEGFGLNLLNTKGKQKFQRKNYQNVPELKTNDKIKTSIILDKKDKIQAKGLKMC